MSYFEMEYVTCENCKSEYTVKIWEEIDITDNEKLKEKILKNEIITHKCKKCGYENGMIYPFLVIDNNLKLMVWHMPSTEKIIKKTIYNLNKDLMEEYDVDSQYSLRITNDYNELKEKIVIREANFDDRVMEILKEIYKSALLASDTEIDKDELIGIYFNTYKKDEEAVEKIEDDKIDKNAEFHMVLTDDRCITIPFERELYDKIVEDSKGIIDNKLEFKWINGNFAEKVLKKMVKKYQDEEKNLEEK